MPTQLSLDAQLFFWWDHLPPGRGVTMEQMMEVVGVSDPQLIRNALTRLRKGEVRDPSSNGSLRRMPIRFNSANGRYYDLSKVTGDLVAQHIPGNVLAEAVKEMLTRVLTLENAIGVGLPMSAQQYLDDPDLRDLIGQLPYDDAWRVHEVVLRIAQARNLLMIEEARRGPPPPQITPPPTP